MCIMKKLNRKTVYGLLLITGLLGFILHIFVFEKPDGNIGMILCMIEAGMITSSTVRLCQLSKEFRDGFKKFIKVVFRF